ncbi:MAG: ECF transporter S component, partial [Acidaminococcaceae bacterium]
MNPRLISTVGIFAGLSTLLAYLDFNLPFFPPFMKLDFADFPSLIIAFAFGPGAGMLVQLIRNCVHLFSTTTGGIGELANMLIGCAMTGTAGYIYQQHHN